MTRLVMRAITPCCVGWNQDLIERTCLPELHLVVAGADQRLAVLGILGPVRWCDSSVGIVHAMSREIL